MSVELSRDASLLLEDIELELASIRAAMALRPLDASQSAPAAAIPSQAAAEPPAAIRKIGPFDLSRASPTPAEPIAAPAPEPEAGVKPKRMTLQQRLASMQDED